MEGYLHPRQAIPLLEGFWDVPDGVLYQLRQGQFVPMRLREIDELLRRIQLGPEDSIPRRFVSLVWMIPVFMEWQLERVGDQGGDAAELQQHANRIRTILEELLGVP